MKMSTWIVTAPFALVFIAGCAPVPPPPPVLGPGTGGWLGWIVAAAAVVVVFILWRKLSEPKSSPKDHLSDAVNELNERLARLEARLDKDAPGKN